MRYQVLLEFFKPYKLRYAIILVLTLVSSELSSRVRSSIYDASEGDSGRETLWSTSRKLIGINPGTNSSDNFKELLMGNAHRKTADTSLDNRLVDLARR